jgi:hypothetical protein
MRVDGAGVDSQSLIELRSGEVPGFLFSLKFSGCPRASPSRQYTAFLHLESHVPSIRHLSPRNDAPGLSERALAATNARSRPVPSRGPGSATGSSSKVGRADIRSVRRLRRQQRRRQQPRRLPPRHDVRLRHGKHRRDGRLRDERQRGQRRRAHRDMRGHQLKSWRCTRYRRKWMQLPRRWFDVT